MKEMLLKRKRIRRVLSAVLCLVMCLSLMPTTVFAAEYISRVNIVGISAPVAGDKVGDNIDKITTGDSSYVISSISWMCDTPGHVKPMLSDEVFEEGLEYSLQVSVEPSSSAFYINEDAVLVFNSGDYATDFYYCISSKNLFGATVSKAALPAPKYTVTFNMNGHGTAPAKQTVTNGSKVTQPANPTASGYTFGGWYTDAACTKWFNFYNVVSEDITLYAKWLKTIDTINILGVKAPIVGKKAGDCLNLSTAAPGYYIDMASWIMSDKGEILYDDDYFVEGWDYYLAVNVALAEGYSFDENTKVLFNGGSVAISRVSFTEGDVNLSSESFTANLENHDFSVRDVTKATLTSNGKIVTKCKNCGEIKSTTTVYYPKTIELSATAYTYDGNVKEPFVSVVDANGNTIEESNYTVTYASGRKNVGSYTVKVAFKGNYSGTKSLTFKINPPKTALKTLTKGKKSFKATWTKKSTQVAGYQIQYSTSSTFASGNKTATVSSYKTVSKTIKRLKAKKKYYVRIRTYKTVGSTKYYSAWSAKKYITTK